MKKNQNQLRFYEVRVREAHTVIYSVLAKDETDAKNHIERDPSPHTVDAQVEEYVSVTEQPR